MSEPFISHSEITGEIYIVCGTKKYNVTEQVIYAVRETGRLEQQRPHGEWIPCSERLPKEHHKLYLVTKKTSGGALFATRSYFFSKKVGWSDEGIVAWMPMPEPYRDRR